ncbi:pectate lyase [Flavobacterium sp. Sd200]|uniref:pectate lyase n=1 Tax=Flavobacterium sp. Sd200 TaxID=2692211 RepID=UPI00136ECB6E|nr:pectate lyase [Flavobacterium sp. Sd200]MXN92523.1 pectate lyase [Flavobacterium sp. Sd200]
MKNFKNILGALLISVTFCVHGQVNKKSWRAITQSNDDAWFASDEAAQIADNVLLYQRNVGGWPKNIEMQEPLSEADKKKLIDLKSTAKESTTDNGATCQEMVFLSKIYKQKPEEKYKEAFLKGLNYLLEAQYKNGGWPQFYPLKKGYYTHITYNDDSMVNILMILKNIKEDANYYSITPSDKVLKQVSTAFDRGIDCILKTQYKQKGVLTSWCAQHDEVTLEPANARAFELASLSGKESAKITLLLMSVKNPSKEVVAAVDAAVAWFEKTKIEGIKVEEVTGADGKKDRVVVQRADAEPLWARFMELDTNRPFFCDRDGIKKYSLAEIGHERRNGYGWYTNEPKEVLKKYTKWKNSLK